MRAAILSILLPAAPAAAFLPAVPAARRAAKVAAAAGSDTAFDIDRAEFCADHFGECSLEEMERLRNGEPKHAERASPALASFSCDFSRGVLK